MAQYDDRECDEEDECRGLPDEIDSREVAHAHSSNENNRQQQQVAGHDDDEEWQRDHSTSRKSENAGSDEETIRSGVEQSTQRGDLVVCPRDETVDEVTRGRDDEDRQRRAVLTRDEKPIKNRDEQQSDERDDVGDGPDAVESRASHESNSSR
ncbi:MAG: hypothetical protein RLZZ587_762 [Actinomycetota bacterium]